MELVRGRLDDGSELWAVQEGGVVHALPRHATLSALLSMTSQEMRSLCEGRLSAEPLRGDRLTPLAPVDPTTEIWAAGVTYERSRVARVDESGKVDIYTHVYDAARPELFFKAPGWRVTGHRGRIASRADSSWTVPEPELALVVNSNGRIVGYTICDDVTSRSIEAENPLYLPQAKMFRGSCAIGPSIRPAWEVNDPTALTITARILRDGRALWEDEASTSSMRRSFQELVKYLFAADDFPDGVVLATGTSLVPPEDVTLLVGDVVEIEIDEVGKLVSTVAAA